MRLRKPLDHVAKPDAALCQWGAAAGNIAVMQTERNANIAPKTRLATCFEPNKPPGHPNRYVSV
jgi:hypothetical protein